MKTPSRRLLFYALCFLAACTGAVTKTQATQPTRLIVPVTAGGSLDVLARKVAQSLAAVSGQTVIVENRPGASAQIGTEYVARSTPDGKTLLIGASFLTINTLQYKGALNPITDLKPVIQLTENEIYLAVYPGLHLANVGDLRELARQRPNGLNCAAAPGQMTLACLRLRTLLGGKVALIPYPGVAPALTDLAAGHVDLIFTTQATLKPLLAAKRVQVVAGLGNGPGKSPMEKLPQMKDFWPGFTMHGYEGVFAPSNTPATVIEVVNQEFSRALETTELTQAIHDLGFIKKGGPADVLRRRLVHDAELYGRIAAEAGLVPQ
jgi:tripartite-type tricarboxylate transporter receptor subunit TctC